MSAKTATIIAAVCVLAGIVIIGISSQGPVSKSAMNYTAPRPKPADLSAFPDQAPSEPLNLLFIHHSCGGQLLGEPGPDDGTDCIYRSHPNGGGLRQRLQRDGYLVHEVSYGSLLGEKTDIFDWFPKFRERMDAVLSCAGQDTVHPDGVRNRIVAFKSCFPNNAFIGEGTAPGNPAGPALTVSNAKAAYQSLLPVFQQHTDTLFVCLTAPPLAPRHPNKALWRRAADWVRGRQEYDLEKGGQLAREFNTWLASTDGWLKDYPLPNVVVFDYYDILTGFGKSNLSEYPTGDQVDSHPSRAGNQMAAELFAPFLNRAAARAKLDRRSS